MEPFSTLEPIRWRSRPNPDLWTRYRADLMALAERIARSAGENVALLDPDLSALLGLDAVHCADMRRSWTQLCEAEHRLIALIADDDLWPESMLRFSQAEALELASVGTLKRAFMRATTASARREILERLVDNLQLRTLHQANARAPRAR